jgi:putative MFS transporter
VSEAERSDLDAGRHLHEPAYRRKLLVLLSAATFFEGYDNFVLAFVLSLVLGDLGGSEAQAGWIRAITGLGTVVAFLLASQADRIGRKRLLLITIVGYTASAFLTALSPNLAFLTGAQFLAQVFLGAEWAVAITIIVEDFPSGERGTTLGIVTSMNTLGGIFVGLLAFVGLQSTPLSWRAFYLVNLVPLALVAIGRRRMLETERYEAVSADPASAHLNHTSVWEPWRPAYRRLVLSVGLLTFFRHAAVAAGAFWWAYYAQQEVGMAVSLSGLYLAAAGVVGALGFILGGRLMDRFGRLPVFQVYMVGTLVFGTHPPSRPSRSRRTSAAERPRGAATRSRFRARSSRRWSSGSWSTT